MSYMMDFFAGTEEKVLAHLGQKLQYPAYVFVRDTVESETGRLAFVDQNNVLKFIRGENKKQVVNVTTLPDVADGDAEVLYIMNGTVYVFDGADYKAQYVDHTDELKDLTSRITALEEKVDNLDPTGGESVDISGLESRVEALENADVEISGKITAIETEVDVLVTEVTDLKTETETISGQVVTLGEEIVALDEKAEHVYEKVSYEITGVPVGTLVDYRENEIRIMCPADTEFSLQSVGAGGDANTYYVTFKTYVPSDAVTGYIEHLDGQSDPEILTTFSTDKYGRRYQPSWLGVAKYDEATDTWAYYGANSTVKKYIGWDYQIDWYNADNVVIASDSIRINLSNEDCHNTIEPYYISGITSEFDELKKENAVLTEKVTELEETIEYIEANSSTFIELE